MKKNEKVDLSIVHCFLISLISSTLILLILLLSGVNLLFADSDVTCQGKNVSVEKDPHPRVALILTGGAARGLCHLGVIKVLEENNIPIDMIIGISMGSIVGGYYAYGYSIEQMLRIAQSFSLTSLIDYEHPFHGFLSGKKLEAIFRRYLDNIRIENLKIPLYIVSTDLNSGTQFIFDHGSLNLAMRASSAIPGVFDPVIYKDKLLVDGGVLSNVPVHLAKQKGADIVIVSNVTVSKTMSRGKIANRIYRFALEYVKKNKAKFEYKNKIPETSIRYLLFRTLLLIENNQQTENNYDESVVDFTIQPVRNEIRPFDFYKVNEGYMLGKAAAEKVVEKIKEKVYGNVSPSIVECP